MSIAHRLRTRLLAQKWERFAFWRAPSITVARFLITNYALSIWSLIDILAVWLLYALFWLEFGGNVAYFFGSATEGLGALAILDTVIMVQRTNRASLYMPLARLVSRGAFIRGLMLATALWRIPSFILLLLLAMSYHRFTPFGIEGASLANMLPGTLGLLVNMMVIALVVVVVSSPIAPRWGQLIFFLWLAAVLYSNTPTDPISMALSISHILVLPLAICFDFGKMATQTIDLVGGLALAVNFLYMIGLILLGQVWFARRDLNLE